MKVIFKRLELKAPYTLNDFFEKKENGFKIIKSQLYARVKYVKGGEENGETKLKTAQREFFEECSIRVPLKLLTKYFEQKNI